MNQVERVIATGTKVTMNGKELIFGETIFHLRDSNDILMIRQLFRIVWQRMDIC